jgi:TolB-like protein/Tfp pilus assembly protein PilF
VTDNSLVQCIKEIRQALGDDEQTIIETVAKRGYVLTATIAEFDQGGLSTAADKTASPPGPLVQRIAPFIVGRRTAITAAGSLAAALLIGGGLWALNPRTKPSQPAAVSTADHRAGENRLSIAVLPFGRWGEGADDYYSIGIGEDVAAALGRFPDLAVTSPGVALRSRDANGGAVELRRDLKVRYLVEGSVRRTPERIRIAVRLTDQPRGILLWSESYDASAATIFTIENDIIIRIAGALAVKLTSLQQIRIAGNSTDSLEAYDLVLRGRDFLARLNRTTHSQARTMFERAIALDPQYAPAYVGLGRVDLSAVALGWTADSEAALRRAEELARKAISLDEFNPAAHVLLGRAYVRLEEYERAVDVLRRAIGLNPSDPDSHAGLGDALLWNGEVEDAIKALEIATSMDPRLSAEDLFSLGAAYFLNQRIADATRTFERVTARKEGNPFIYAMLAAAYAETGRDGDSRSAANELRKLNPFFDVAHFGSLFKKAEHRERLANALKKTGL